MRVELSRSLLAVPVLAAVLVAGCSDSSSPTAPTTAKISATATTYLNQALDWEQDNSYYTAKINWASARPDVIAKAGAAQKPSDTYGAIQYSLDQYLKPLGDDHSGFWPPSSAPGRSNSPSNDAHYQILGSVIAPKIAYMQIPSYAGTNDLGHVDSTVTLIKSLDAGAPCGWIFDLRTNLGGTWAVMLTALNPFVGDGNFAGAQFSDGSKIQLYVQQGEAGVFDPAANRRYPYLKSSNLYTLRKSNQPVALLQGINTASAGELILLAFKGNATPARSFGGDSRGDTSTPVGTYLTPDSAYLNITAGLMFDRTSKIWGTPVPPDQVVTGGASWPTAGQTSDPVVQAALAWLNARPECSGTSTQQIPAPSATRIPQRIVVAPEAAPNAPRPKVSPFFGTMRRSGTN
jgi:carboxyl-terminal processing protease